VPVISSAAVGSIGLYRRYVSPYKGFSCAHRVFNGGSSCSTFAEQAIRDHGVWAALPMIKCHFLECREAYSALQSLLRVQEQTGEGKKGSPLTKQGDCCVNVCTLPCL
jgi:putative component of membrane protein insertase Oxa1/YidC/SpoIIIJ protein YidD